MPKQDGRDLSVATHTNPYVATSAESLRTSTRRRIPVRWVLAVLLLLLSVLNYVDRQALSILATTIQGELKLSDTDYARIGQIFLLCYTVAYLLCGRIVDRIGPRLAETAFVAWWSVANMLTAWATGFGSLLMFRGLLGLAEPGHYAVSAKVVGQWFPPREKGIAVGLYTMGGTLGAAVAAPLVAWLTLQHSWQAAFVFTGALGLVFAVVWWICYRPPQAHPWMSAGEATFLREHGVLDATRIAATPLPLREIVRWKPLWLIMGVRCLTDPVWYFYLVWFAKFLQEQRGFTLGDVGRWLWLVFVAADLGCLLAGVFAGQLIRRGVPAVQARVRVMCCAAAVLALSFMFPLGGGGWAIACASLFAFCVMLFMASCVTLPIDLFPASSLGSAQGLIGMGGSIGGMISTGLVATVIGRWNYDTVFAGMSFLHPVAVILLVTLLPQLQRTLKTESN